MQLNEILEENTVKGISQKTKISEDNLEKLLAGNFEALKKIKTLGFISIIEREYKADLSAIREEALEYYGQHREDRHFSVGAPLEDEGRDRSKLFLFVVLALLGYASWYFFTQFDQKHLSGLIPFMDEKMIETTTIEPEDIKKEITVEDLSIANRVVEEKVEAVTVQETNPSSEAIVKEMNASVEPVTQF